MRYALAVHWRIIRSYRCDSSHGDMDKQKTIGGLLRKLFDFLFWVLSDFRRNQGLLLSGAVA